MMAPTELPAAVVATSFSFIELDDSHGSISVGFYDGWCKRLRHGWCGSVTNFKDALEHDTHPYREARHAEDQASRCLVSSEYTNQ
jgi:hypothetical protein